MAAPRPVAKFLGGSACLKAMAGSKRQKPSSKIQAITARTPSQIVTVSLPRIEIRRYSRTIISTPTARAKRREGLKEIDTSSASQICNGAVVYLSLKSDSSGVSLDENW